MYNLVATNRFKKDLKLAIKRNLDIGLLKQVTDLLQAGQPLPEQYRDHALTGVFEGCRECHIKPDWLLIYKVSDQELILYLTRTGSHSDLFGK